jgi:outer membrane protein OmpA-like peptidoglycan-associated protein
MKTPQFLILVTFVALFAGCATVAPNELVNARSAYRHASEGPAEQLVPAELHKAHDALVLAEQSFLKEPDSHKTKDLAYVAQRKSEQAGALGAMAADKAKKDKANADFQKKQAEIVKQGKQDLSDSEKRTAEVQAELDTLAAVKASKDKSDADFQKQQAEIMRQGKQDLSDSEKRTADARAELDKLAADKASKDKADADFQKQQAEIVRQGKQDLSDSEKRTADARAELDKLAADKASKDKADADFQKQQQAEIVRQGKQDLSDSEKRTAVALAELAKLAAVKEEERGLVLTLSGSVLFRSAESTLLSSAQVKLGQVANALLAVRARNLIVEGHTDSQGSESYNQGLSQRRADAVRDYLVQRGYPADRIQARGKGKGSPIADNASPEGRANNRRVEIVIER